MDEKLLRQEVTRSLSACGLDPDTDLWIFTASGVPLHAQAGAMNSPIGPGSERTALLTAVLGAIERLVAHRPLGHVRIETEIKVLDLVVLETDRLACLSQNRASARGVRPDQVRDEFGGVLKKIEIGELAEPTAGLKDLKPEELDRIWTK